VILSVEFAHLPMPRGGGLACPVVDLTINGVVEAPLRCLIDTGAAGVRLPGSTAEVLGVDLSGAIPGPPHLIGGTETLLHEADVELACAGYEWQATVSFCVPDFAGFGLAGIRGFFDKIYVGVDGYLQVVQLEPHDDRLERLGLDSAGRPLRQPRSL
jgi:hypothetical protein